MQEAAFDASAAAGYDLPRYDAIDRLWLVRETEIDYIAPLYYGDSVEVTTWVVDMRKVRSRRAYELRNASSGALVARASTDWAFLEKSTGRPAGIPSDMVEALFPGGLPDAPRKRFPAPPPAPPEVFRQRRHVEWRDLDPGQHVNNSVYLAYVEECGVQIDNAYGWPEARLRAEGIGIFTRRHWIDYQAQAVLDDELEISTWFSGVRATSATRHCSITRVADGARVAQVHSVYVWVDRQTGKPVRIPQELLADFAPNRSPEEPQRAPG
jgi:acyl-CoA thioester hydrolase